MREALTYLSSIFFIMFGTKLYRQISRGINYALVIADLFLFAKKDVLCLSFLIIRT